jgi:redox-sensitive bicupin YhaK (pirin superfamily)
MKTIIHKSDKRGHADHGWLKTYHSFSFANYYNPEKVQFGALRVLNDDWIAPGEGFGTHPHDNMEIITIPLSGELEHSDSMGNTGIIRKGEIQVMSAGIGIQHSEFNASTKNELTLLQIWLYPNKQNVEPRYDQISLKDIEKKNELFQILSPNKDEQGVWIHQDAWFYLGNLDTGWKGDYNLKRNNHGVYVFVIDGTVEIQNNQLLARDAIALTQTDKVSISAKENANILIMEVPMIF